MTRECSRLRELRAWLRGPQVGGRRPSRCTTCIPAIGSPPTLLLQRRAPCACQFKPGNRRALKKIIGALSGAVSSPLAGPWAA
ncbi:hypothetical protein GDR29_24595 [Xanthomonas oryzae pv. oryzae]|nr:hypothetical protein GDR29_24595 [Xanthomonas oryzae pv. oryzae]